MRTLAMIVALMAAFVMTSANSVQAQSLESQLAQNRAKMLQLNQEFNELVENIQAGQRLDIIGKDFCQLSNKFLAIAENSVELLQSSQNDVDPAEKQAMCELIKSMNDRFQQFATVISIIRQRHS